MADRRPAEILAPRRGIDTADWFERLSGARAVVLEELRLLDYRHVLARGLMTGRFLRWFDGASALADPVRRRAGEDRLGYLIDRPPRRGPVEPVKRHGGHDRRHQGEQRRMLLGEHRPV